MVSAILPVGSAYKRSLAAYRKRVALAYVVTAVFQSASVLRCRSIQTSASQLAGGRWRLERGLPANNNRYGPLTDLPDYSFVDGRPTPIGGGQLRRKQMNLELAKRIQKLAGEVKFAKDRYQNLQQEGQQERERLLKRKLKPKSDS